MIECRNCSVEIAKSKLAQHLEERHVGPRLFNVMYLCCGTCEFRVSGENSLAIMEHALATDHDPDRFWMNWSNFLPVENERLAQLISTGIRILRESNPSQQITENITSNYEFRNEEPETFLEKSSLNEAIKVEETGDDSVHMKQELALVPEESKKRKIASNPLGPRIKKHKEDFDESILFYLKAKEAGSNTLYPPGINKVQKRGIRVAVRNFCLRNGNLMYVKDGQELEVVTDLAKAKEIIKEVHEGEEPHLSMNRGRDIIRSRFYWYGMSKDIKEYSRNCALCNRSAKEPTENPYFVK